MVGRRGIVDIGKLKDDTRIMGAIAEQLQGFTGDVIVI